MNRKVDVLVVGAGPSGLFLATELVRAGVEVLLIDGCAGQSRGPDAAHAPRRTNELLAGADAVEDIVGSTLLIQEALANPLITATLGHAEVASEVSPGSRAPAQSEEESLLVSALREAHGQVVYGTALYECDVSGSVVHAALVNRDGKRWVVECRWLVGCDDTHEDVRHALGGVGEDRRNTPAAVVLGELGACWLGDGPRKASHGEWQAAGPVFDGSDSTAVHDIQRRHELAVILPESALTPLISENRNSARGVLDLISRVIAHQFPAGVRLGAVRWLGMYCAGDYSLPGEARCRVFLVGDAAHLPSRNIVHATRVGLQDAHNLAWKLVLAARGLAGRHLLGSYAAERHLVDSPRAVDGTPGDTLAACHGAEFAAGIKVRLNHRGSSIILDERAGSSAASLAAGDHVPDAGPLDRPLSAQTFGIHEWLGRGRHVLVGFVTDVAAAENFLAMLRFLRLALGDLSGGVVIVPQGVHLPSNDELPVLVDTHRSFATGFNAQAGMAWMVRPDGYIGWCSDSPSVPALRSYLRGIVEIVREEGA